MIQTSARRLPAGLVRTRPLIAQGLHGAVDRLPDLLRLPVAYHLGLSDAEGRAADGDGGKAIRPAITLLAAEAVGADPRSALPGAVALELVHNFSLLHDDVMDGDRERRHRPTVWALFGVGEAIVAGDALKALALEILLEDGRPESRRAALELTRATAEMIRGQAEDLAFESRLDVTEDEALAMSAHKTAALLSCAGVLGAVLGGAEDRRVEGLRRFGWDLGVAFQAVDDVLGIWGDPAVTGKPVASDLRQHKKTLPVVHALTSSGPAGARLRLALSNGELDEEAVAGAARALDEAGSREWTAALAARHLAAALSAIDTIGLEPPAAADLREAALFVTGRAF